MIDRRAIIAAALAAIASSALDTDGSGTGPR